MILNVNVEPMRNNLTGPTNELAKERNRAAAERTITSWIQSCLGLIGFGVAVDEIAVALDSRSAAGIRPITSDFAYPIGYIFILLGIGLLVFAMVQHYLAVQSIKREDYVFLPSRPMNVLATSTVIIFGFLGMVILGLSLS
jgi:putative membrane protein